MDPRSLAQMAVANKLPEISAPDALPAMKEAIGGIEAREVVSYALRIHAPALGKLHPGVSRLHAALQAIGAKLAPAMSPAQAMAWRDATGLSLAKYSVKAAIYAAETAQGEPFQYGLGSVDGRLHELAKEAMECDRAAVLRLQAMIRQIERAQTQKALPAPEDKPLTVEEIAATPDHIISLGRTGGFISDEDYQAAMALRETQCSGS